MTNPTTTELRERLESALAEVRAALACTETEGFTHTSVYTATLRALLSSAEAREESDRQRCLLADRALAEAQRAQQAEARVEALTEAVGEAEIQITYLHEKFGETGSGNAVLARLRAVLGLTEPQAIQQGEDNDR